MRFFLLFSLPRMSASICSLDRGTEHHAAGCREKQSKNACDAFPLQRKIKSASSCANRTAFSSGAASRVVFSR